MKRHTRNDLLAYAVERYNETCVNDGPDALLVGVPSASLAQSTVKPWGDDITRGVIFQLRDDQGRPLTEGRVGLTRAGHRHLRWWPVPGSITDLLAKERRAGLN